MLQFVAPSISDCLTLQKFVIFLRLHFSSRFYQKSHPEWVLTGLYPEGHRCLQTPWHYVFPLLVCETFRAFITQQAYQIKMCEVTEPKKGLLIWCKQNYIDHILTFRVSHVRTTERVSPGHTQSGHSSLWTCKIGFVLLNVMVTFCTSGICYTAVQYNIQHLAQRWFFI